MRPTIRRERNSWVIRINGRLTGAFQHWQHAMKQADRIITHKARERAAQDLARARAANDRMEANR